MDALSITGGNTVVNINIGDGGMLEAAAILAKQTIMKEIKPKISEALCILIPGWVSCWCIPFNSFCDPESQISTALAFTSAPKRFMTLSCLNPILPFPNPLEMICGLVFGAHGPPNPCFCFTYCGACCFGEDCVALTDIFPKIMDPASAAGGNMELDDLKIILGICAAAIAVGAAATKAAVDGNPEPGTGAVAVEMQMKGAPKQHWVWAKKRQGGKTAGKLQVRYFTLTNGVLAYYEKVLDSPKKSFNLKGFTVSAEDNKVHMNANDAAVQNTEIEFYKLPETLDAVKAQEDFIKAAEKHIKFANKS